MSNADLKSGRSALWVIAVIIVSMLAAMFVAWRAPGLSLYARDALVRARGVIPPPSEVMIVAIDEASIKRFGRFPWPRTVIAQALDKIAAAHPKAIGINVLFSEPTIEADDLALVDSIKRAGNVVVAAQLIETPLRRAEWLRPLPMIEAAATGMGHGNVLTDVDGVARAITLRETDDDGNALWATAVQLIRVSDGADVEDVRDIPDAVKIGSRTIPVEADSPMTTIVSRDQNSGTKTIRASRVLIDYIGPAGSFSGNTLSLTDLIDGRLDTEKLRGKYVLLGATAAAMSDRVASPFARYAGDDGNQNGALVSGVEVLANALATMLRSRFYKETPDWAAAVFAALIAAAVIGGLRLARGRYELLKQIGVLIGLVVVILVLSYLSFSRSLILPPVIPALVSLTVAAPLTLLRLALTASASLDARIAELVFESAALSPLKLRGQVETGRLNWIPRGTEAKAEALAVLQKRLLARTRFVDLALRSVEDGLIIADTQGLIAFANPRAAQIFGAPDKQMFGGNLFEHLNLAVTGGHVPDQTQIERMTREILPQLLNGRASIEREIAISGSPTRFYTLRMATVNGDNDGRPIGIVATISDITKQRELRQMQTDVMALVTHEMKTPLTAIQGMSEVLMKFEPEAAKRREMNQAINEAAQRLKRMIDEYLDLTRLESGARPLRLTYKRVESLIEHNLLLIEPLAALRGIRLKREVAEHLPALLADADLISCALTNLVTNAIKYSPVNTEITVSARADADSLVLSVTDQGYGVPAEHRMLIFEKFYRVPRVEDADAPGAGLGLAMVREIAELHGGRVMVDSGVGSGSTFTLRLPFNPPAGEPPEK